MSRKLAITCALILALFCAATPARAVIERDCIVAIQAKSGWSREQKTTVYFMTGLELSRITTVMRIEFHQVYAVITNGRNLPTVVRLDTVLLGVRREFTDADFVRLFASDYDRVATQIDGEGRSLKWRLRGRTAGGWIDEDMPSVTASIR